MTDAPEPHPFIDERTRTGPREGARQRILFVGEAVTLAHVVRSLALARTLDPSRYEIHVAWDGRYDAVLGPVPFHRWPLASISSARFATRIARGVPLYDRATLERYVTDDLALLDAVRPDLVIGDMRLSLAVSARLAGVPYAAIANAHFSPFADVRYPAPLHPSTRLFGRRATEWFMNRFRDLITGIHLGPMNRVRARHQMSPLPAGSFRHYADGDHVLYADAPGLVPMQPLPAHHHFLGPVVWSPSMPQPAWWNELPVGRPVVYVNLGSSGKGSLLPVVLEGLADLPVSVVIATVGATLPVARDNVYVSDYLSGHEACQRASLVVCNGGSGAVQQALLAGTPVLGVTGHFDQQLNMQAPVRHGAAVELRADQVTVARVRELATAALASQALSTHAARLSHHLRAHDSTERFPELVRSMLGGAAARKHAA